MTKQDEVFADVFSATPSAAKATEPQAEQLVKAEEPPKATEPEAQKEPAQTATVPEPQPQQLSQEEYLALRRSREEAREAKTALEIERLKAANIERELAQFKQQQQQKPKEPVPDVWENPEARLAHQEQTWEQKLTMQNLRASEFHATREYGAALINEVKQWALGLDDARANHLVSQPSPFHAAVEMFRQEKAAAQLKEHDYDLEKLKAKWLSELQAQQAQASPAAQPTATAPTLPPKIAGAGGGLGKAPTPSEDTIFRSVFTR